jgi:hypothetical protein
MFECLSILEISKFNLKSICQFWQSIEAPIEYLKKQNKTPTIGLSYGECARITGKANEDVAIADVKNVTKSKNICEFIGKNCS